MFMPPQGTLSIVEFPMNVNDAVLFAFHALQFFGCMVIHDEGC
jgi:hypothetical protein